MRSDTPSVQGSSRPESPITNNVPSPSCSPGLTSALQIETNQATTTMATTGKIFHFLLLNVVNL